MSIGGSGRVRCARDIHVREFDGELVILDLAKGDYFGVNEIGAHLWRALGRGTTCSDVAKELAGQYEVEEEQLLRDLVALADDFLARGLVERIADTDR